MRHVFQTKNCVSSNLLHAVPDRVLRNGHVVFAHTHGKWPWPFLRLGDSTVSEDFELGDGHVASLTLAQPRAIQLAFVFLQNITSCSTALVVPTSVIVEVAAAINVITSHCTYLDSFQKSPFQLCTCERVEVLAPTSVSYRELQQHGKAALLQSAMNHKRTRSVAR